MTALNTRDSSIRKELSKSLGRKNNSTIVHEFPIRGGVVRADIVEIGEHIHGYELKGDLDNLDRLRHQTELYNQVFDKVTLVVGKKHLLESLRIIPQWWGVTVAKSTNISTVTLIPIRDAQINPLQDTYSLASLLWKEEIIQMAQIYLNTKKFGSRTKRDLCNYLTKHIDSEFLKEKIRERLFNHYVEFSSIALA